MTGWFVLQLSLTSRKGRQGKEGRKGGIVGPTQLEREEQNDRLLRKQEKSMKGATRRVRCGGGRKRGKKIEVSCGL